jgi:hypothetical protein
LNLDHTVQDEHQQVRRRALNKQACPFRVAHRDVVAGDFVYEFTRQAGLSHAAKNPASFFVEHV